MATLAILKGDGNLLFAGDQVAPVAYKLEIFRRGQLLDGGGTLSGASADLHSAMSADSCALQLSDGRKVEIVITSLGRVAIFQTSGPLPYP